MVTSTCSTCGHSKVWLCSSCTATAASSDGSIHRHSPITHRGANTANSTYNAYNRKLSDTPRIATTYSTRGTTTSMRYANDKKRLHLRTAQCTMLVNATMCDALRSVLVRYRDTKATGTSSACNVALLPLSCYKTSTTATDPAPYPTYGYTRNEPCMLG